MTEVVAVVDSDRKPGNHRRRFLVPSEEYAGRGRFGFVIVHARHVEYDGPSSFVGWESRGGWAMIDLRTLNVAKAIGARRETQLHLDCLTRQIAARAGRQATTVRVLSRARHQSDPRIYHQELVDCLTFEHWANST